MYGVNEYVLLNKNGFDRQSNYVDTFTLLRVWFVVERKDGGLRVLVFI